MEIMTLSGRATRLDWWLEQIGGIFLSGVVGGIAIGLTRRMGLWEQYGEWIVIAAIIGVVILTYLWMTFAVTIRRLHDRGRSGWFILVYWVLNLIPFVNFIAGIAFLIDMGLLDGVHGPNQWGEDSKGRTSPYHSGPIVVNVTQNDVIATGVNAKAAKFCANCGAKLDDDSVFCTQCGKPVGGLKG